MFSTLAAPFVLALLYLSAGLVGFHVGAGSKVFYCCIAQVKRSYICVPRRLLSHLNFSFCLQG
jgi:hypothetical protein